VGEPEVLRRKIMENAADLREVRLQEVLDFIAFLRTREKGYEDSILEVAGCLSGSPLSAVDIEEGLYGESPA